MRKKSKKSSNWKLIIFTILIKIQMLLKQIVDRFNPLIKVFWETQYLNGDWDHLNKLEHVPLYSVLAGYFQFFKQGGSILDVGCGEGIFQERIGLNSYSKYVGIDISNEAIKSASYKEDEKTYFKRIDVNNFETTETFDIIVFSEILYYLGYTIIPKFMKKYESFLKKDGMFIISMMDNPNTNEIWRTLESMYPLIDKTEISNKSGHSWTCKVFFPTGE